MIAHELHRSGSFWAFLVSIDKDLAECTRQKGCSCGGRLSKVKLQLDVLARSHDEMTDLADKVFELSQTLRQQGLIADSSKPLTRQECDRFRPQPATPHRSTSSWRRP